MKGSIQSILFEFILTLLFCDVFSFFFFFVYFFKWRKRDCEKQSFQTVSRTQFPATSSKYLALQAIIYNPPLDPAICNHHSFVILSWKLCSPRLPFKEKYTKIEKKLIILSFLVLNLSGDDGDRWKIFERRIAYVYQPKHNLFCIVR